ncbi:MAG: VOC family protein [Pseudomonadota bacterium]
MTLEPYLSFNGRCEEALAFYKEALDAEVTMQMRMNEAPDPPPADCIPAGFENKIMHASMRIGEMNLMMTDGNSAEPPSFKGFSLTLGVADEAEAERRFNALQKGGGKVTMPLGKTFWSPCFGMLEDKFGVGWMVIVPPADAPTN